MCHFARDDYLCGDWKWRNLVEKCPRETRMGEVCGAKLVHSENITKKPEVCKVCREIGVKVRHLRKTCNNIDRWVQQPDEFPAILEKARAEKQQLCKEIRELETRRLSYKYRLTSTRINPLLPAAESQQQEYFLPIPHNSNWDDRLRNISTGYNIAKLQLPDRYNS